MPLSKYYDGKGEEVMAQMKKQYGDKKGEQIFYATANKQKKKGHKKSATLKAKQRSHIATKNFAIPGKAENAKEKKKSGNYPIHDIEHARSALRLVGMHGTDEEKAQVRAKVHAKYPSLKKTAGTGLLAEHLIKNAEYEPGVKQRVMHKVAGVIKAAACRKHARGQLAEKIRNSKTEGSNPHSFQVMDADQGVGTTPFAKRGKTPNASIEKTANPGVPGNMFELIDHTIEMMRKEAWVKGDIQEGTQQIREDLGSTKKSVGEVGEHLKALNEKVDRGSKGLVGAAAGVPLGAGLGMLITKLMKTNPDAADYMLGILLGGGGGALAGAGLGSTYGREWNIGKGGTVGETTT